MNFRVKVFLTTIDKLVSELKNSHDKYCTIILQKNSIFYLSYKVKLICLNKYVAKFKFQIKII